MVGDYNILDLKLSEENHPIGHYGWLHRDYLKEEHPAWYSLLVLGLDVMDIPCRPERVGRGNHKK